MTFVQRAHLSARDRLRIFWRHEGVCHLCGGKIQAGEAWDISHETPLEMGGADDDLNRKPAHRKCHRHHTSTVDAPMIAKAKRREAKHLGIRPRSQFACSRQSKWKKKVDGTVVLR